jgi:formylglycine-generating enzyme required for sulfatase activity/tRNA A-37 threonylcarbamoyl transferase component Bud32
LIDSRGEGPDSAGPGQPALQALLEEQSSGWLRGEHVLVEVYLARHPALQADPEAALDLITNEVLLRQQAGEKPQLAEYLERFPQWAAPLRVQFEVEHAIEGETLPPETSLPPPPTLPWIPPARQRDPALPTVPGYEILDELGHGGMGVVYKARQQKLDRVVALKMIQHLPVADGEKFTTLLERLQSEAQAIAQLQHPDIVQIFELGECRGLPFLALEYVPGGSLARKLAGTPQPADEAVALMEVLARAMHAAHQAGVLHRDLKPDNILLTSDGSPKISDFGLAKRLDAEAGQTATGMIMGTPSYMAPEQAEGKSKEVSVAADVYSLGAILYELLTGRPPFRAATVLDTLFQVKNQDPVPPRQLNPAVPRDLETICLKCLEKAPGKRYPSAETLAADLARWRVGEPILARPASRLERTVKWARRRPTAASLLAVGVLAALALAVLSGVAVRQWQLAVTALAGERAAQSHRALAQVDTLLSAEPRAVPPILAALDEPGEDVLSRVRQVWDEPDTPRHRRMRAALVLLVTEPTQVRDDLVGWMLEVPDPAELLLIRAALLPHAAELRSHLWRQLRQSDKPSRRLRLLAALAAFDREGPGWKEMGQWALEPWLSDNPLYLGTWTEALRPARHTLVGPLTEVFKGRVLGQHRQLAANILADYARDRPRTLADLIVEADDQQFGTLLPVLRRHRAQVLPLLRREIQAAGQAGSLSYELRSQIEAAGGLLTERFALVQTLPLEEFARLAEGLRPSGYRPVRCRPYRVGERVQVAALWTRDGRDWHLLQGVSAERIRQEHEKQQKRGYEAVDVAGWLGPRKTGEHYTALWVRGEETSKPAPKPRAATKTQLYVGVPEVRHELSAWRPLKNAGYVLLTSHVQYGADGTRHYSAVWDDLSPAPAWRSNYWIDELDYENRLTPDQVQQDVDVRRALGQTAQKITPTVNLGQKEDWPRLEELVRQQANNPKVLYDTAVVHGQAAQRIHLGDLAAAVALVGRGQPLGCLVDIAKMPRADAGGIPSWPTRKHQDRAVALLERSVAAGLARCWDIRTDPRLAPLHDHPGYQALVARFHPEREYSAVWHTTDAWESVETHGLAPEAHRTRCRELQAQGYHPVALSVAETITGRPLVTASVWQRARISEAAREALARRQAGAALALLKLGQAESVWPLLVHSPFPEARSRLSLRLGPVGVEAQVLEKRLEVETDVSIRRSLILALGEYPAQRVPAALRRRLVSKLLAWYRTDPDPGIHGAIDWLLRHDHEGPTPRPLAWGQAKALQKVDDELAAALRAVQAAALVGHLGTTVGPGAVVTTGPVVGWGELASGPLAATAGGRGWYVNGQGQTLAIVDGRQPFLMGSPADEADHLPREAMHWRGIGRRYAIGTRPVTAREFQRFLKAHPGVWHPSTRQALREPDAPAVQVTWYEASQYCRWLSEQEGIPEHEMVYPRVDEIEKCKDGVTPLRLPANYLKRRGYRLPTEAEWEYACRAGARTSRYYGSSLELLPRYAWYQDNAREQPWPVGQKRPNDLGLFDMHGNVMTWCQERLRIYPGGSQDRPSRDEEDSRDIVDRFDRPLRGASFGTRAWGVRAAFRFTTYRPRDRFSVIGLRVARTCD